MQNVKLEVGYDKWIKKNISIDFAMGLDQEGFSLDQVICNKGRILIFYKFKKCLKMTSLKGMDELFWGKEFEDVHDWVERLEMAVEMKGIDELKLFKIGRLNFEK